MPVLVIADHDNSALKDATRNAITAASQIDADVHLFIAGHECSAVVDAAKAIGALSKILHADSAELQYHLPENCAPLIAENASGYSHILAPSSTFGKNLMPRIAALLDTQQISDISAVIDADTFERPIYAGNAIATVKSSDTQKVITVRGTSFDAAALEGSCDSVDTLSAPGDSNIARFVGQELSQSDRPELTSAKVVISGGRALGSAENFEIIEKLADKLGGAIGASRAAVDAGYISNDYQVGQTGKVVAPELYIAIGISGAIQHLAGMKDSKVIVAINKDEEAPIFQIADYGLVADLFEAVPELESKL